MKYTIKGLTDATIRLNALNITLRGNYKTPSGIAKGVDVSTSQQIAELDALTKNGFITYAADDAVEVAQDNVVAVKDIGRDALYKEIGELAKNKNATVLSHDANELLSKILDLYEQDLISGTTTIKIFQYAIASKGSSVQKGESSKEKAETKAVKADQKVDQKAEVLKKQPKKAKKITRMEQSETVETTDEDAAIVISNGKAVKVAANKGMVATEDADKVKESLAAAKKMEDEEQGMEFLETIDEENVPVQDRMGNDVVIGTGAEPQTKKIVKSIVDKEDVKWIDKNDDDNNEVSDAFLDKQEIIERNKQDADKFIE